MGLIRRSHVYSSPIATADHRLALLGGLFGSALPPLDHLQNAVH